MARYADIVQVIPRVGELIKAILDIIKDFGRGKFDSYSASAEILNTVNDMLDAIPTADVRPERHGQWLPCNDDNKKRCSRCDTICLIAVYPAWKTALFCPVCGAKMDGKDGEQE